MTMEPTVSVVIPCYNEVGTLRELHTQLREVFTQLDIAAEILFIDDGSTDGSREALRELAAADADCRVIAFRRNCGKAAALDVGFRAARGEFVLTMDADLQDDPLEIPRFLAALQDVDVVSGWKATRHDPAGKTLPSRLFNATVRQVTGVKLHDMNCGFKGYRRQVLQEVTLYGELHRFIPALAAARGFRIGELIVTHHPRRSGVSKYGWERFVRGLLDLITVFYLTRYRYRPLHFFGGIGIGLSLFGLIYSLVLSAFGGYYRQSDWRSFFWMIAFTSFIIGPLLVAIGLIAESQLAAGLRQLPEPPVVERINLPQAAGEVDHAG